MGATAVMGISAWGQGEAAKRTANYQRAIGEINARQDEMYAERTIKNARKEAEDYQRQIKKTVGSQRANLAAQGVDVNLDSAMDIQTETLNIGARDASTIRNNGYLEALGYKTRAINTRFQGEMGVQAANNFATNSLISSGIKGLMTSGALNSSPTTAKSGRGAQAGGSYNNFSNYA